jgi:ADP-ribose pyrophosphatase YjhB (NUDIX family)
MTQAERFKFFAAAHLVLIKDGHILLLRRHNTGYHDGNYSLVAGHLDGGETAAQCISREAKEEANIIVASKDLRVIHVMHRQVSDREYFDIYLRTEIWLGDITNMEPDKCSELAWFELASLPANMVPEVKFALENISKNIQYSEFGR